MAKTISEKIALARAEMQQCENEIKRLVQLQKEADRKARTKRLIARGALLESLIPNAADLTNEQVGAFLGKTITSQYAVKMLAEIAAQGESADTEKPQNAQGQAAT